MGTNTRKYSGRFFVVTRNGAIRDVFLVGCMLIFDYCEVPTQFCNIGIQYWCITFWCLDNYFKPSTVGINIESLTKEETVYDDPKTYISIIIIIYNNITVSTYV